MDKKEYTPEQWKEDSEALGWALACTGLIIICILLMVV